MIPNESIDFEGKINNLLSRRVMLAPLVNRGRKADLSKTDKKKNLNKLAQLNQISEKNFFSGIMKGKE